MKKTIAFLLAVLVATFFTGCSADEEDDLSASIAVAGVVTSDLGQPLGMVLVKSTQDSAFTDEKGGYTVRAYPRGSIEYYKPGYVKHIEPVAEQGEINIILKRILDGSATHFGERLVELPCGNDTAAAATVVEIMDFGQGTGTMTWTKNKVWVLKNSVFVNEGQTLTIEPGTIIKGANGLPDSTGTLVVAKGGKLMANGTKELPIIFTAESDSITRDTNGQLCRGTNLGRSEKGLWGGVVIFGNAVLGADSATLRLDGFPDVETRAVFGGNNDDGNSGTLRHIAIRHAGKMGGGLILAGVGAGTSVGHIEVSACSGDGFRFLGGKVNSKHLVSAHNSGNAFHSENGWRGLNQFWLATGNAGAGMVTVGAMSTDSSATAPSAGPIVLNATFQGPGDSTGRSAVLVRGATGGGFYNCIFLDYAAGVSVPFQGPGWEGLQEKALDGMPVFKNNIFGGIPGPVVFTINMENPPPTGDDETASFQVAMNDHFQNGANGNLLADPGLDGALVPETGGTAASGGFIHPNAFFETAPYRGCFAPGELAWAAGFQKKY